MDKKTDRGGLQTGIVGLEKDRGESEGGSRWIENG